MNKLLPIVLACLLAGACFENRVPDHEHDGPGTGPGFNMAPDTGTPDAGVDAAEDADTTPLAPIECDGYCQFMAANCPGVFLEDGDCEQACAQYAVTGSRGDTRGDTLQCRYYYAELAAELGDLACERAAPEGGGFCGDPLEAVGTRDNPIEVALGDRVAYLATEGEDAVWFSVVLDAPTDLGVETSPVNPDTAVQGCAGDTEIFLFLEGNDSEAADAQNADIRQPPHANRCSRIGPSTHPAVHPAPAGTHLIRAGSQRNASAGQNYLRVWEVAPLDDGDACLTSVGVCGDGLRCDAALGVCVENLCGDGFAVGQEACDDGNERDGDGCEGCEVAPIARGNACDLTDTVLICADGDVCRDAVCSENVCGDGFPAGEELCDDGNDDETDGCLSTCHYSPYNGDAEPDSRQAPYALAIDGDRGQVVFELGVDDDDWFAFEVETSGSVGVVAFAVGDAECVGNPALTLFDDEGVELAADDNSGPGLCPRVALDLDAGSYVARLSAPETTDGNWLQVRLLGTPPGFGDACEASDHFFSCPQAAYCGPEQTCVEHACGDGVLGPNEVCDDGNTDDGDGCQSDCVPGLVEVGNRCSPQENLRCRGGAYCNDDDLCAAHRCGDNLIGPGEECDGGLLCDDECRVMPGCGNRRVEAGEQCDDGGLEDGDGCDALCAAEFNATAGGNFELTTSRGNPAWVVLYPAVASRFRFATHGGDEGCPGDTQIAVYEIVEEGRTLVFENDDAPLVDARPCSAGGLLLQAGTYVVEVTSELDLNIQLQVTAPERAGEGQACDPDRGTPLCQGDLACRGAVCVAQGCGDSETLSGEECDDGNDDDGDGCSSTCTVENQGDPRGGRWDLTIPERGTAWLAFDIERSTRAVFATGTEGCPGDTALSVLRFENDSLRLIGANDDSQRDEAQPPCSALSVPLEPGRYVLAVQGPPGAVTVDGVFQVELRDSDECVVDDEIALCGPGLGCYGGQCGPLRPDGCGDGELDPGEECDDGANADGDGCSPACRAEVRLEGLGLISAPIPQDGAVWVSFALPDWTDARIATQDRDGGCAGDTVMSLIDVASGRILGTNDDGPAPPCSEFSTFLPEGNYAVRVRGPQGQALIGNHVIVEAP